MNQTTTFDITLAEPDGTRFGPPTGFHFQCSRPPRFLHVCDDVVELSDSAEPDTPAKHVDSFAHLITVGVNVLYVRCP